MAKGGKRTITGYKKFDKAVRFTGKWALKGLAKIPEIAVRGSTKLVDALAKSEQFQVIATTGGLVAASVFVPYVALGFGTVACGKLLADTIAGKTKINGKRKNILDEIKETILLGNQLTKFVCERGISPAMRVANNKTKSLGKKAQTKIDDLFK